MSLSTYTLKRLPQIKEGLRAGQSRETIGKRCGVTEKTIDRDIGAWVESGLFEVWLKEEFVDLHTYARDNDPIEAYKQVAKIIAKMVTRKIEAKAEISERIEVVHLDVTADEDGVLNEAARILDKRLQAKKQPASIH